uniref:Uncharacterized protein n=1 Tax=Cajanus cajan TaxID=3821 RepID=A0A151QQT3_CAJCA|nr:hypothetical protein KK1_046620 [Cajanus cajan]
MPLTGNANTDDEEVDLRIDPSQEGGYDGGPSKEDTCLMAIGPLTRSMVRRLEEASTEEVLFRPILNMSIEYNFSF